LPLGLSQVVKILFFAPLVLVLLTPVQMLELRADGVVHRCLGSVEFVVEHVHSVERVKVVEVFRVDPTGIYLIRGFYGGCGAGLPCSPGDFYWGRASISDGGVVVVGSKHVGSRYSMWCSEVNNCTVVACGVRLRVVGSLEASTRRVPLAFASMGNVYLYFSVSARS